MDGGGRPDGGVTVRPAVVADRDEIRRVLRVLHPDGGTTTTLPHVRQEARTFVATDADRVVGVAVATFVDYGHGGYGMVEELAVEASHRRAGTGRRLLDQCTSWLQRSGAEVVFVSAVSEDVVGFYVAAGFARCVGPWLQWVPTPRGAEPA